MTTAVDASVAARLEGEENVLLTVAEHTAAQLGAADAAMARVVAAVARHGRRIVADTGLSVEVWLTTSCGLLRGDAKAVLQAAAVLPDLPFTWARFNDGDLPWAVVRTLSAWLARPARDVRVAVDGAIEQGWDRLARAHPGAVLDVAERILAETNMRAERRRERRQAWGEFLVMQPNLDGTGGSLYAEYGAINFTAVSDAIVDARPQPDTQPNPRGYDDIRAKNAEAIGQANAAGLVALCSRQDDGTAKRPLLLASVSLETLLGLADQPGHLLTHLTNGSLRVTAQAARELTDRPQGADLRLHVFDDGRPVGVGHTAYVPPDWLRDLARTAHHACTRPGCRRPARQADLDHAVPWDKDVPEQGGATDIDNLHPACRSDHRAKTRRDWHVEIGDDQSVTWTHPRTGTSLTQLSVWAIDQLARPALDRIAPAGRRRRRKRRAA